MRLLQRSKPVPLYQEIVASGTHFARQTWNSPKVRWDTDRDTTGTAAREPLTARLKLRWEGPCQPLLVVGLPEGPQSGCGPCAKGSSPAGRGSA